VPGVQFTTIASAGESFNLKPDGVTPYRMVGIPDGLGAFSNGDGTFTVLMNHELGGTAGIARAHGSAGAFVSRWKIRASDLKVIKIEDHATSPTSIFLFDLATETYPAVGTTTVWQRFCSADLPAPSAFFNPHSGKGTRNRIFMDGEESDEGRAFAHVVTGPDKGKSYDLPYLGKFGWENSLACPFAQDQTLVIGTDDSTPGQVYLFIGEKQRRGLDVEKAGLADGELYALKVPGVAVETRAAAVGAAKGVPVAVELVALGEVDGLSESELEARSDAAGATEFLRPEDGSWDPLKPNDFYFVTTDTVDIAKFDNNPATVAGITGASRLWRLRFRDLRHPTTAGATLTLLIDGRDENGPQMMDNFTVDAHNRLIIQEDPGGNPISSKLWSYDLVDGQLLPIAKHDPARFGESEPPAAVVPATAPFSNNEEASGVIPAEDILGRGMYLLDVQAHYAWPNGVAATRDPEIVEGGQLLTMKLPPRRGPLGDFLALVLRYLDDLNDHCPRGISTTPVQGDAGVAQK